uniref:Uncharacterized protein n=1 Tax=Anguilla anguilla TaxID=7936 RepID=A0A0E9X8D8_ANGAN
MLNHFHKSKLLAVICCFFPTTTQMEITTSENER